MWSVYVSGELFQLTRSTHFGGGAGGIAYSITSAYRRQGGHDVASISMCLLAPGAQRSGVVSRTSIQSATNVFDVVVVERFPGYPLAVLDGRQKILG